MDAHDVLQAQESTDSSISSLHQKVYPATYTAIPWKAFIIDTVTKYIARLQLLRSVGE